MNEWCFRDLDYTEEINEIGHHKETDHSKIVLLGLTFYELDLVISINY